MSGVPENLGADLSAYLDGELPAARAREIEALLNQDAECRAELEQLRAVRQQLAALPRHMAPPEVRAALGEMGHGPDRRQTGGGGHRTFRLFVRLTAAAAVLAGCFFVGWEIRSYRQRTAAPRVATLAHPYSATEDKSTVAGASESPRAADDLELNFAAAPKDEVVALGQPPSVETEQGDQLRQQLRSLGYVSPSESPGVTLPPPLRPDYMANADLHASIFKAGVPAAVDVNVRSQTRDQYRAAYSVLTSNSLQPQAPAEVERRGGAGGGRDSAEKDTAVELVGDIPRAQVSVLIDELNQCAPSAVTVDIAGKALTPRSEEDSVLQSRLGVAQYKETGGDSKQAEEAAREPLTKGRSDAPASAPAALGGGLIGGGPIGAPGGATPRAVRPSRPPAAPALARESAPAPSAAKRAGKSASAATTQPARAERLRALERARDSRGVVTDVVLGLRWFAQRLPPPPAEQVRVRVLLLPPPEASPAPAATSP